MFWKTIATIAIPLGVALADVLFTDDAWIDRLLDKHKEMLDKHIPKDKPVDLQVEVVPKAAPDFKDPKEWTYDSVLLLLRLMKESKSAKPALDIVSRAGNSGTKLRDGDELNALIRIKEHTQIQLPSSEIRVMGVMDILGNPKGEHSELSTLQTAVPPVDLSMIKD